MDLFRYLTDEDKKEFENQKEILRKRFKKEPSENDVFWSLFGFNELKHVSKRQWGLFRNTKMLRAKLLQSEKRYKQALENYFEVCIFDMNGANNMPEGSDMNDLKEIGWKEFDVSLSFIAPGIIKEIKLILKIEKISDREFASLFKKIYLRVTKMVKLPLSFSECLNKLRTEVF